MFFELVFLFQVFLQFIFMSPYSTFSNVTKTQGSHRFEKCLNFTMSNKCVWFCPFTITVFEKCWNINKIGQAKIKLLLKIIISLSFNALLFPVTCNIKRKTVFCLLLVTCVNSFAYCITEYCLINVMSGTWNSRLVPVLPQTKWKIQEPVKLWLKHEKVCF